MRARLQRLARYATSAYRTLPGFLIIGAQKAGTTSLYQYLAQHPLIRAASRKEVHYFDNHLARGALWYRSNFPLGGLPNTHREWITGEATPSYLFYPRTPLHVQKLIPEVKCVAVLRNPVDRAFSHYQMQVQKGVETLSFPEALEAEPKRIGDHLSRAEVEDDHHLDLAKFSYLSRGLYAQQLQRWLELFEPTQLLVLSAEELFEHPATVTQQALTFLELPAAEETIHYSAHNAQSYDPLDPALRKELARHFHSHNQQLYRLLGRSFDWDDAAASADLDALPPS